MKIGVFRIFALTSIVFLGVLAVSPLKNRFSDWRKYQNEYNELLDRQPMKTYRVSTGVKQIWAPDLGKIDRCVSCHLGLSETGLTGAVEPFKAHPEIYHDYEKFGCTVCHRGQGLATSREKAMSRTEFWEEPLLPREYLESSCGSCHKERSVPQAEHLNSGRDLIEKLSCTGCHVIRGYSKSSTPSLNGIGRKVDRQWLADWLKDPYAMKWDSRMPDFMLSDEEALAIADFLSTFSETPLKLRPLPAALQAESFGDELIESGKARFREARCISCHSIDERGGRLASELGKIGSKVSRSWLYNFLKDPQALQPGIPMPRYGFSERDLQAVVAYMTTELIDWEREQPAAPEGKAAVDRFEKGLQLYNEYNCSGCHELNYPKVIRNMGPELTLMGEKALYELPVSPDSNIEALHDYVRGKLENPRQYIGNLRMPRYNLSQRESLDLAVAILALTGRNFPDEYIVEGSAPGSARLRGKVGEIVGKYSCLSCHLINGEGYLLATDLTLEGSLAQESWLRDYFRTPYTIRPILTERMPNLFMTDGEIETLVEYFKANLLDDAMDSITIDLENTDMISRGRDLLYNKYGCQSCHQIDGAGGYVGPPLDKTGSRLRPGWVFSRILDPQKYVPDTIEPETGMTADEAKAITSYLMSLK